MKGLTAEQRAVLPAALALDNGECSVIASKTVNVADQIGPNYLFNKFETKR